MKGKDNLLKGVIYHNIKEKTTPFGLII